MYEVSDALYLRIAEHLSDAIGRKSFFSGCVPITEGDVECSLCCTLIVSRSKEVVGGEYPRITRLMPVWWELKTTMAGEVIDNDFSFGEMLTYFY